MKTLSVIVPIYNVEQYLYDCIDSILNQSFIDFELILVNDGSTDNCSNICQEYAKKDDRVFLIEQDNKGLSGARNIALEKATGKYFCFVDSDDIIRKDMFESMIRIMDDYNLDLLKSNFARFEKKISEIGPGQYSKVLSFMNREEAIDNMINTVFSGEKKVKVTVWDAMYRRSKFGHIRFIEGLLYEDGYYTADILAASEKIGHIDDAYYFYRVNSVGIMGKGLTEKSLKSIDIWKYIHDRFAPISPKIAKDSALRWLYSYVSLHDQLKTTDNISDKVKKQTNTYMLEIFYRNILYNHSLGISYRQLFWFFRKLL